MWRGAGGEEEFHRGFLALFSLFSHPLALVKIWKILTKKYGKFPVKAEQLIPCGARCDWSKTPSCWVFPFSPQKIRPLLWKGILSKTCHQLVQMAWFSGHLPQNFLNQSQIFLSKRWFSSHLLVTNRLQTAVAKTPREKQGFSKKCLSPGTTSESNACMCSIWDQGGICYSTSCRIRCGISS